MDQLIDVMWESEPPSTARAQVQFCVHAMRSEFDRLGIAARIVTHAPGYRLETERGSVDSEVFERQVDAARARAAAGDAETAVALYRESLGLWRGPLLDGAPRLLRDQGAWLDSLRKESLEHLIQLELDMGGHRRLVGELRTLVNADPLREQLRCLLMLALYRCGRQSDALEVYRRGRDLLRTELGVEPGAALKRLESAVLTDDHALLGEQDEPRIGVSEAVMTPQPAPRQLPAAVDDLEGREVAISAVERALCATEGIAVPIVNVTGMPGVGKSALAVHVAHRVTAEFPDGQLYVNLGATQATPLSAHDVFGTVLRMLGVLGTGIPDDEVERGDLYRTLLARRRMLLVFEDAKDEAQVAPLIPGTATCAVLLTSRSRLTGLPGVQVVHLDVLSSDAALALLTNIIGEQRTASEPQSALELVRIAGGMPLALRIVGAKLARRRHWTIRAMVRIVADEQRRLDELSHGEMVVRGSLMVSYDGLERGVANLVRRLGLLETPTIPSWVPSAVMDDDGDHVFDLMDRLVDTQLIECVGTEGMPRYRLHDLVRIFVREQARAQEPEIETDVVRRVLGGWLALAEHAHRKLHGGDFSVLHSDAPRWAVPVEHLDEVDRDPLAWLEAERVHICAAIAQGANLGLDDLCWDLAVTLVSLFEVRANYDDWKQSHEIALQVVERTGNSRGRAALHSSLASLYLCQSRLDLAESLLAPALETFVEIGDAQGVAMVRRSLGRLDRQVGVPERARKQYALALEGFTSVGDVVGAATVLGLSAQLALDEGDLRGALELLDTAKARCSSVHSPRVQSQIKYKRGKVLLAMGQYGAADVELSEVLELVRAGNDVAGETYALHALGVVRMHCGELTEASPLLEAAAVRYEHHRDVTGAARVWLDLAEVAQRRGETQIAESLACKAREAFADHQMWTWVATADRWLVPRTNRRSAEEHSR